MKKLKDEKVIRGFDKAGVFIMIDNRRFRTVTAAAQYLLTKHRCSVHAALEVALRESPAHNRRSRQQHFNEFNRRIARLKFMPALPGHMSYTLAERNYLP